VYVLVGELSVPVTTLSSSRGKKRPVSSISTTPAGKYPLGTTFVVKSTAGNLLLTAFHTFEANHECTSWFITKVVNRDEKNGNWVFDNDLLEVSRVYEHRDLDVALISVTRPGFTFDQKEMIPICPPEHLPVSSEEPQFKTYYYAIDDVSMETMTYLDFSYTEWKKMYMISRFHLYLHGGLCGGSSGGLVINRAREAVAMHIESFNNSKSVQDISNEGGRSSSKSDLNSMISESLNSLHNTHSSTQKCVILSNEVLLEEFRRLSIII